MDRRRTERQVGPVVAGGPGTLGEERHAERILDRPVTRHARTLDAGCHVDADRRDGPDGVGDVCRIQPAGEGDRQLARDERGQPLRGAGPGAAGVWPAGGVEEEALDPAGEVGMAARHDLAGSAGELLGLAGREVEHLPGPPPDRPCGLDRLARR